MTTKKARGAYMNDRDPNRWDGVVGPLNRAFDIRVQATQFDPPPRSRPCCWSGCSEPIATGYLCAKHLAACKCRDGRVHFVGEGCDDNLNAEGICSVCASECSQDVGDAAVAQEEAK